MTPRKLLPNAAPKPKPRAPKKPQFGSSIVDRRSHKEKLLAAQRLRSTTPLKKKSRKPSEFARIYGSKERVTWVKRQPCMACGCRANIEVAHVRTGGTSRKADARWTVPLCGPHLSIDGKMMPVEGCHRLLHRVGQKTFEAWKNVDLKSAASWTEAAWQAYAFSKSEVG